MRLALANVLALVSYVAALWTCVAVTLGFATNPDAPWGFTIRLNNETFGFAVIGLMFTGPLFLIAGLIYFAAFRARPWAIATLAVAAILLSIAFMTPLLNLPGWPGGSRGGVDVRGWIITVWVGVTATLAHHIVFALVRPRRV